jgi:antitoxin ParD1/3/4
LLDFNKLASLGVGGRNPMPASARTVSLTEHQQRFLDGQVRAGRHGSTSEVVREALRRYEDDVLREEAHLAYLKRLGDEGDADIAAGCYVDVPRDGLKDYLRGLGRRAREE